MRLRSLRLRGEGRGSSSTVSSAERFMLAGEGDKAREEDRLRNFMVNLLAGAPSRTFLRRTAGRGSSSSLSSAERFDPRVGRESPFAASSAERFVLTREGDKAREEDRLRNFMVNLFSGAPTWTFLRRKAGRGSSSSLSSAERFAPA
jgi:hypothetical protein